MPLQYDDDNGGWAKWSMFVVKTLERLDSNINQTEDIHNRDIKDLRIAMNELEKVYRTCMFELERAQNEKNTAFATAISDMKVRITLLSAGAAAAVSTIVSIVVLVIFK
jgi:hypothetical protein